MLELQQLSTRLKQAAVRAPRDAAAIVSKGALNVKTDARGNAEASAGAHAPGYPSTITYDLDVTPVGAVAEIGPEKRGQGNLGNLLEFGSANNPPHRDVGRAFDVEEPRFAVAAAKLPELHLL